MDTYLSKVKKSSSKPKPESEPKKKETTEEFKEEESEYYKKDKNMIDKFLDFILGEETSKPEVKEIEKIEKEIEEEIKEEKEFEEELKEIDQKPKKGFFQKIKQVIFFNKDEDDVIYEEIETQKEVKPDINEEIKEALKIQNRWLTRLSPKEIKRFKQSEDYTRYVEILEKHKLLKKN